MVIMDSTVYRQEDVAGKGEAAATGIRPQCVSEALVSDLLSRSTAEGRAVDFCLCPEADHAVVGVSSGLEGKRILEIQKLPEGLYFRRSRISGIPRDQGRIPECIACRDIKGLQDLAPLTKGAHTICAKGCHEISAYDPGGEVILEISAVKPKADGFVMRPRFV